MDPVERFFHKHMVDPVERFVKRVEERAKRLEKRIDAWDKDEETPDAPHDIGVTPTDVTPIDVKPINAVTSVAPQPGSSPQLDAVRVILPPPPTVRTKELWRSFSSNKPAVVGLCMVLLLFLLAAVAPLLMPYEMAIKQNVRAKFEPPSAAHWLGTDYVGRDVMARLLHGARVSLTMGFLPSLCSMAVGMLLGSAAAYCGNMTDNIIMRVSDIFHCIPGVLLALSFVAALGPGLNNMLIAITIASIPSSTRFVRAVILNIVDKEYIEAARACGSSPVRIITRHVLPNAIGPLILQTVSYIAGMIMTGAGLSFLGLGLQPPNPEWGYMLSEYQKYLRNAPYLMLAPGLAMLVSVLAFNLLGDGLRDALDPKLRR